jgi:AraC-like DNA-binding protein
MIFNRVSRVPFMSSRLDCVTDWDNLADLAKYRVATLAGRCRVTERQLRRYFRDRFHASPHSWMTAKRLQKSRVRLSQGASVKEASAEAGFQRQENFSRRFKAYYKVNPSDLRSRGVT